MDTMTDTQRLPTIGDTIYVPRAWSYGTNRVPCPVCFGKMCAVLILGNGEHVTIECDACGRGFEGPQGWVDDPCAGSCVDTATIDGLVMEYGALKVMCDHSKHTMGVDAFWTEAEAEAVRVKLFAKAKIDAENNAHMRHGYATKRLTWTVAYHRSELKKARRAIDYHTTKLSDALGRQRQPKPESKP